MFLFLCPPKFLNYPFHFFSKLFLVYLLLSTVFLFPVSWLMDQYCLLRLLYRVHYHLQWYSCFYFLLPMLGGFAGLYFLQGGGGVVFHFGVPGGADFAGFLFCAAVAGGIEGEAGLDAFKFCGD